MCNPNTPSVTLQTAVLMQAREFAQQNRTFSVHDITRNVRNKVDQGELEIPEAEVSGASFRFDIPHAKVRAIFRELWNTGVFDPEFTLAENYNGTFNVYTPTMVNVPNVTATANLVPTAPPATITGPTAPTPPVVQTPSVTTKPSKQEIQDRTAIYLGRCQARNFRPTLKQVQSAIKRGPVSTGWTCDELQIIIEDDLGYEVVNDPDYVSASQVVL